MNKAIAWFASNNVAANLLMFFFVIGGLMTMFTIKLEVFPETALDKITITTEYPGASPSEVEEAIIARIEERVAGLAGTRRVDSVAREGFGTVTLEVVQGWDLQKLLDEVKAEVDRIQSFPDEAEEPVVRELTRRVEVMWVAVYGDATESTLKHLAEEVKDELTSLAGITQVELLGVRRGEIHIEVSEAALRRHALTLDQVARAVRRSSLDLPAGRIKTKGGEILVRAKGRRYNAADYADIPILTRPGGSKLTLGQIAHLKDGFEDRDLFARYNNKPAALIQVFRVADQNALDVAAKVKQYILDRHGALPAGVNIDYMLDRSRILKDRMNLLIRNLAMGFVFVALVLGFFLELRLAFWVTLGIPISFLIGLWFLPLVDVSINMISLFAFILVLGIVVDDAIVVGENIFKKREDGMKPLEAAIKGCQEVGGPVVFSVLTTVAAFAPLLVGTGMMGKIMRHIPWVVILVLLGSLLESLFVLPAHLAHSKAGSKKKPKRMAAWLKNFIAGPYSRMLDFCLLWRYATFGLGVAVLLVFLGTFMGGFIKFTLFPQVESDFVIASLTMPAGTPIERTTDATRRLEEGALEGLAAMDQENPQGSEPLLKGLMSIVGVQIATRGPHAGALDSGGHVSTMFLEMLEGEKRNRTAAEVADRWRRTVGGISESQSLTYQSELFTPGNPVEVHLSAADKGRLHQARDRLKEQLATLPGVFDIADSHVRGKDELQIDLKPSSQVLGLTLAEVSQQVRNAFYGAEALRMVKDKDEIKVMVRYPETSRRSLADIERMRIRTPDGHQIPFSQLAEVRRVEGYAAIQRSDRRQVIKVTADIDDQVTNSNEVRALLTKEVLPALVRDFPGLYWDMEGEAREQRESLMDVGQGMVIALFAIYMLLAIPFRSFTQPFIVMGAIPFGVVGALAGHLVMGLDLSLLSLFGIVGLTGVVVNDSLVLIFQANRLRSGGLSPEESIKQAGAHRFRAILLTSVTTFAGLTPIIFETSMQAQFLIPMAVSLGFGVLSATGITLLLVPCGYLILEDMLSLPARLLGKKPAQVS